MDNLFVKPPKRNNYFFPKNTPYGSGEDIFSM